MSDADTVDDLVALTRKYYYRLRELLELLPDDQLHRSMSASGMSAIEALRHVAQCDLWYVIRIDGKERELPEASVDRAGALELLAFSEGEVLEFLGTVDPETLDISREVDSWWGEGEERSGTLIMMHSLAHKYYHCGQLQLRLD